jgi:uncharacterized membrane protein YgdD (TMEM256/DUF423 family)
MMNRISAAPSILSVDCFSLGRLRFRLPNEQKTRLAAAEIAGTFPAMNTTVFRLAAGLIFLAVAFGAFGAHALKETLAVHETTDAWNKAVLYQFVHALALLVLATLPAVTRWPAILFFAGIVLFSGSLYVLALTNIRWLGAITPLGGLCFLVGWLALIVWPPR